MPNYKLTTISTTTKLPLITIINYHTKSYFYFLYLCMHKNKEEMESKGKTSLPTDLLTEKQHLVLKLRIAMKMSRYDVVEKLGLDLHNINIK